MASIPRLSRWAVVDSNIVILARTTDYCAPKLLRIVAVDFAHFSPARPLGLHADFGEPLLFGQYCMRNREPCCEGARLLQVDSKAEHHAAKDIDDHSQKRSLDRLSVLLIDNDDIDGRMINLGHG